MRLFLLFVFFALSPLPAAFAQYEEEPNATYIDQDSTDVTVLRVESYNGKSDSYELANRKYDWFHLIHLHGMGKVFLNLPEGFEPLSNPIPDFSEQLIFDRANDYRESRPFNGSTPRPMSVITLIVKESAINDQFQGIGFYNTWGEYNAFHGAISHALDTSTWSGHRFFFPKSELSWGKRVVLKNGETYVEVFVGVPFIFATGKMSGYTVFKPYSVFKSIDAQGNITIYHNWDSLAQQNYVLGIGTKFDRKDELVKKVLDYYYVDPCRAKILQ